MESDTVTVVRVTHYELSPGQEYQGASLLVVPTNMIRKAPPPQGQAGPSNAVTASAHAASAAPVEPNIIGDQPGSSSGRPRPASRKRCRGESQRESSAEPDDIHGSAGQPRNRIGDHKIAVNDVIRMNLAAPSPSAPQDICQFISSHLRSSDDRIYRNETGSVELTGEFTLPGPLGDVPRYRGTTSFHRMLPVGIIPTPFEIGHGSSILVNKLDLAAASDYMKGSVPSCRSIIDGFKGSLILSRPIGEGLAPSFSIGLHLYDISAVWTVGTLIEFQLADLEFLDIAPVFGAAHTEDVLYAQLDVNGPADVNRVLEIVNEGLTRGALFLDSRDIADLDIAVLRLLTVGTDGITTPVGNRNHIASSFRTPPFHFILYGTGERSIPAIANVTSMAVRTTLMRLSAMLEAGSMAVKGFVRASTIMNGKLIREHAPPARRGQVVYQWRWMTSLLELGSIVLPRPLGYNFMWRLLKIEVNFLDKAIFMAEHDLLNCESTDNRTLIGAGIAAMLSLAMSSILNNFNLTGRELNSYNSVIPQEQQPAYNLLRGLFNQPDTQMFNSIIIFSSACNLVSQFVACSINAACIATANWCGSFAEINNHGPTYLWQGTWGLRVPYIINIASLSWAYQKWLDVWGITSPAGNFNIDAEIELAGDKDTRCLNFRNGDIRYDRQKFGYEYVPYAAFCINVLRQHLRTNAHWRLTYIPLVRQGNGIIREHRAIQDANIQPLWLDEVYLVAPGTICSYDWLTDAVMAPCVLAADMDPQIWSGLMCSPGTVNSPYSGIYREKCQVSVNRNYRRFDFAHLFPGF